MAKKLIPSAHEQKDPQGFPAVLASAVYEWVLIFLLFVNGLLSYLVTKFACFCKLQPPCVLCSRLDHVVGNEDPGFYKKYLCNAHRLEISSLVFCPIHDKLADVHGMCEGCLFSFATEKKSNSEAYKILVGKLGSELFRCRDQDSLVKNSVSKSQCSCCNDTWTSRSYFHKLLQTKSLGAKVTESETPSPGSAGLSRVRDNLKKRSRRQSGQKEWSYLRSRSFDPLSHIGYSELKITSESESEVPFSDEDDASGPVHEADDIKEDFVAQSVQLEAHTTEPQTVFKTPHDLAQEELIYQASIPRTSLSVSNEQLDVAVPHNGQSSISNVPIPSPSFVVSEEKLNDGVPHDVKSPKSTVAIPRPSLLVSDKQLDVGAPHDAQSSTATVAIPSHSLLVSDEQLDVGVPSDVQCSTSTVAIPRNSLLVSDEQLDVGVPNDVQCSTPTVGIGNGLEELNWRQAERQTVLNASPEFISVKDVPAPPDSISLEDTLLPAETAEVPEKILVRIGAGDTDQLSTTDGGEVVATLETDLAMPTEPCLKISQVVEVSEGTCVVDVALTDSTEHTSVVERVELHKLENGEIHDLEGGLSTTSGPCSKTEQVLNDAGLPVPNLLGLTNTYKLSVGNKSQVSSVLAEQLTGKDSTRVTEDLKLLLSQVSAGRGIELSSTEMHVLGEESRDSDSSSSVRLQFFPKRISMERNDSGSESLDGSIVSEIEGESVVDRLKRQVEYDRKSMSALYKELEEERNASAVAANQAMAMITRLQEEKASLHMEALQYLRMMEEQAEYDVEELQKANDLLADKEKEMQDLEYELAEKEKEMQDLEAELEVYRRKLSNESMDENIQEPCYALNGENMELEHPDESCIGQNANLPCNSLVSKESEGSNAYEKSDMINGDNCMSAVKDSLLNFEDERIYISESLKKLEKQLHLVSSNGVHGDNSTGGYSVKESHATHDLEQPHCTEENHRNGHLQEDEASGLNDSSIDGLSSHESCNPSVGNSQFARKENHQYSDSDAGTPLAVIGNEFSDLNERLDSIEADRTFLEHAINALQSGDEGVEFLKEIAQHLRELRRFGIRRGDQTVA